MFLFQRNFLISSLAVLAAACAVLYLLYRQMTYAALAEHGQEANIALAKVMKNVVWANFGDHLSTAGNMSTLTLRHHPMTTDLRIILEAYTEGSALVKIKIFDTKGRTVFSTDPSQIGQVKPNHEFLSQALAGRVATEYRHREHFNAFGKTITNRDIVSSYVPIKGRDGKVEAVFELYDDVTDMIGAIESIEFRIFGFALVFLWILYGCLVLVVRRAQQIHARDLREISSKQVALETANNALSDIIRERKATEQVLIELNDTLEERVEDRTEQLQQREAALFENEQRFRDFAEASSDYYWEMDEALRYSYFSHRYKSITGVDPKTLLGRTYQECEPPDLDDENWQRHFGDLENHRSFRNFVYSRRQQDGQLVWLSSSGIAHFDENGTFQGYRGTGYDITEQIVAEQSAEKARQEAVDASKAKSDFLANMSHELRTPLNAIIGYTELLQEEAGERNDAPLLDDLIKVRKASSHLLDLINNVLDLSKIEANKSNVTLEQIDLKDLISDVSNTIEPLVAENGNTLKITVRTGLLSLITDGLMLRQTLVNLLGNAAKFTASGEVCLAVEQDGADCLRLVVSDTGVGMSKEQINRIFEPFMQGDATIGKQYGGTGLGLTLCKRHVELLNGRLDVESHLGGGSRFTISLPIQEVDAAGLTALTA